PQTMTMAAGAITRLSDGGPLFALNRTFYYDAVPLTVVGTTPTDGSLVTIPLTTLDVQFNEAINAASIDAADLALSQGTVVSAAALNATTVRYTLSGVTVEGTLNFTVAGGALTDVFGNPNATYSGSYTLDYGTIAFPGTFTRVNPG